MKYKWPIPIIYLFFGLYLVAACMDEDIPVATYNRKPTAVEYIRQQIEQKHLSLPDKNIKHGKQTRSASYDVEDFTADWDNYQYFNRRENRVWLIPFEPSTPVVGQVYTRVGKSIKNYSTPATFKLMVRKVGDVGKCRILTYIPEHYYLKDKKNPRPDKLGYDLRGSNYSGIVIQSTLKGEIINGLKYENGKIQFSFAPRRNLCIDGISHLEEQEHTHAEGEVCNHEQKSSSFQISMSFQSRKLTRSTTYSGSENDYEFCPDCNMLVNDCICNDTFCYNCGFQECVCGNLDGTGELNCSFCGKLVEYCTCLEVPPTPCEYCGQVECACCIICKPFPCACANRFPPEPDEENNEGTGGGGGSTGGGDVNLGGGDYVDPNPDEETPEDNPEPPAIDYAKIEEAKRLFRNSELPIEDWAIVAEAVDSLKKDAFVSTLYDALLDELDGSKILIKRKEDGGGSECAWTNTEIRWDMVKQDNLLHEMFHIYQAYSETPETLRAAALNIEVEAHLMQYKYLQRTLSQLEFYEWDNNLDKRWYNIRSLAMLVNEYGGLAPGIDYDFVNDFIYSEDFINSFREHRYPSSNFPVNENRTGSENFKNLIKLQQ